MSRIYIVDAEEGRTPFLRGILTRSLQHEAGLGFEQAYGLASDLRDALVAKGEADVKRDALRRRVEQALEERFGSEVASRYRQSTLTPPTILVRHDQDTTLPFSRSILRRSLEASGIDLERANNVAAEIFEDLVQGQFEEITAGELGRRTHARVGEMLGARAARRYLAWCAFAQSDRTLITLIGGVPGSGKSTIANEVAHRLEIVRVQSTDMLREVMRTMAPERLLPALHASSFLAWRKLPANALRSEDPDELLAEGYRAQAELVSVACEAVIDRSLRERESLILEGVHVDSQLVGRVLSKENAVVVPVMLAVLKPSTLKARLRGRGRKVVGRRASRYLAHFDEIWREQSFLLSEADRTGTPIIANFDKDRVVQEIIQVVVDALVASTESTPREVFRDE